MFQLGPWCAKLVPGVPSWSLVFQVGPWCSKVVPGVPRWSLVFQGGPWCSKVVPVVPRWSLVFQVGPWCSKLLPGVQTWSLVCGSGRPRRGTARLWPLSSYPGSSFGGSVSRRQSAPSTYLRQEGCPCTARSRAAPGASIGDRSSSLACLGLATCRSTASDRPSPSTNPSSAGGRRSLRTTSCWNAAPCWNQKPGLPYFKWWGGWASTRVAMRYATAFLDHGVLASLALPCPGSEVGEPQVVNCLSLSVSTMFGADAVEESVGSVGSVLGPTLPHPGAVAVELPATVVGGGSNGAPGHESDSSSTSSEGSSSCESSDSDVRIIEPPVGKGVTAGPAFRIGTEERPARSSQGGGAGRRKRKRQAPPPTTRERPGRCRVRALGVPSDPERGGGGGQAGPQVGVEVVCSGIPPTPQRCVLRPRSAQVALGAAPCLNNVPLAMRSRAGVQSSRPRACQRNSKDARGSPDPLLSPLSCSSSSAHRNPDSPLPFPPSPGLPSRPPPEPPPPSPLPPRAVKEEMPLFVQFMEVVAPSLLWIAGKLSCPVELLFKRSICF